MGIPANLPQERIPAAVEAFADTLVETLNRASLALMTSIGHRTSETGS